MAVSDHGWGHGRLIFALPPGEAAFHPSEENGLHEPYFM